MASQELIQSELMEKAKEEMWHKLHEEELLGTAIATRVMFQLKTDVDRRGRRRWYVEGTAGPDITIKTKKVIAPLYH